MELFGLEEFAARRRREQTEIEARLRDEVERAIDRRIDTHSWQDLVDALREEYARIYFDETGDRIQPQLPRGIVTQIKATLRKTHREGRVRDGEVDQATVDRITPWLSTLILNLATVAASQVDPEELFLEWVHMDDLDVRKEHREAGGQVRPIGENYDVGGVAMRYPGDPRAPIELWINCRCVLRPVLASEQAVKTISLRSVTEHFAPQSATLPEGNTSTCVVALPTEADDVHEAGEEPSHVTLLFVGEVDDEFAESLRSLTEGVAQTLEPFNAEVAGHGILGPDKAKVLILEAHEFNIAHGALEQDEAVAAHLRSIDTHPHFVPHLTVTYGDEPPEITEYAQITFDRLAVWHRDDQTEYPLGDTVTEKTEASFAISEKPWNGSPSRFTDEQYKRSCVLHVCDGMEKSCHKLPIKEPNGDLSRRGTHAAAQRLSSVTGATDEQKASAKRALRGAYKQLGDEPPDNIKAALDWDRFEEELIEAMTKPIDDLTAAGEVKVPWYGVLAPEGEMSGDRRLFKEGSLTHRDLPLPLTWQKISDDGHKGNVTVATIETIEKADGLMKASGYFLDTPEADEVTGLISEFGKFGVSVDADDSTFEVNEEDESVEFSSARVCSACIVPIPAFTQAWIALGTWDSHEAEGHEVPEAAADDALMHTEIDTPEQFVDVAPGRTEDGPGWLTHPVDTDRLRDYWVRGPGAAKIAWGTPGDFNRCRANVAEYVKPQHINGYCANRHYDALGRWPGRHGAAADTLQTADEQGEALSIVASAGHCAPSEWFKNPNLSGPSALTVTDEGRVFGHLATWGTCHIGFDGTCVDPPKSATAYAYFLTGEVVLDDGGRCPVGNITIGGGHAPPRLGLKPALAHYDSTSAVVADVTCGEDDHGVWVAGWVRPGADDDMVTALRASALSGDWRKVGGNLELVAALAVNVPGFGIPRTQVAASSEGQLSLVASGVVEPSKKTQRQFEGIDLEELGASVARHLQAQQDRKQKMAALAARLDGN